MKSTNWKLILPVAALLGFALVGLWGLVAGPLAAFVLLGAARRRNATARGRSEDERLAAYVAQAASQAAAAPAPAPAPPPPRRKPAFAELQQRVAALAPAELFGALASSRLALAQDPRDAHAAVEAALVVKRVAADRAQVDVRTRAAAKAIGASLAIGQSALALNVFAEFETERESIGLPASTWEALGRIQLSQGAFSAAAWSLHRSAILAGDAVGAQRRLIDVAAKAAAAGQNATAAALYTTLLETHADSRFADFARAGLRAEQKKLARA